MRSTFRLTAFSLAAAVVLVASSVTAAAVAVVVDTVGEVSVTAAGATRPLARFDRLETGAELATASGASAALAFMNGRRVTVGPGSKVSVGEAGVSVVSGSVTDLPAVATGPAIAAIPAAQRPGRRSGAIRIRGASVWGGEVEGLYPRDGAAIAADAATLSFAPIAAVESYRVDIEDDRGQTVFEVETRSPTVSVPAGVLRPGVEYYWRVRSAGRRDVGGQGEALFLTLDERTAADLARLESQLSGEASPSSSLLLAEVNRSLGRYREACAHLARAEELTGGRSLGEERDAFQCDGYATSGR